MNVKNISITLTYYLFNNYLCDNYLNVSMLESIKSLQGKTITCSSLIYANQLTYMSEFKGCWNNNNIYKFKSNIICMSFTYYKTMKTWIIKML